MKEQGTTTKSASDLYLDLKVIKLEINKFKAEKELAKIELKEYQEARDAIQNEYVHGIDIGDLRDKVLSNIKAGLQRDIDVLSKNKTLLENSAEQKYNETKSLKEKIVKLSSQKDDISSQLQKTTQELEKAREEKNQEIKLLNSEIEKISNNLKEIRKSNEIELQTITGARKELEDERKLRMKEDIRLANKSSDLHIYEARLRKKYLELMPGVEIVV